MIIIIIIIIIIITTILSSFSTGYCWYRLNHSSQLRDTTLSGRNRWAVPMNGITVTFEAPLLDLKVI